MIFSCFSPDDMMIFSYFVVDWNRNIFTIPYLNHSLSWYGVLFAFGFFVGYFLSRKILRDYLLKNLTSEEDAKNKALFLIDRLSIFVIIGAVLGARFGHVFFYDWSFYKKHPMEILKIWEGGLASHGGVLGILVALYFFVSSTKKEASYLTFSFALDLLVIPAAFAAGCIRIGNFINQEILGTPTFLPWGIIFGHPAQNVGHIALHPVQIYESLAYFFIFGFLLWLWKLRRKVLGDGILAATFFTLVFGFRFFIEFFKLPQSEFYDGKNLLNMGQLLSIPFVLIGVFFLIYRLLFHKKNKI